MYSLSYRERRGQIETYFDRTAADAWSKLTSDAPVSRIRATVRAGRDQMRATLLSYLPDDLRGARILDAGCGTGALACEAARRGAHVVAIDIAPTLVDLARERAQNAKPGDPFYTGSGHVDFRTGDMLDPALGTFDHVVAMDSLIHYATPDMVSMLASLSVCAKKSVLFTFAPKTPALTVMHTIGRLFPRSDRAPAIEPVDGRKVREAIGKEAGLDGWSAMRGRRIDSGFYMSEAMELVRR